MRITQEEADALGRKIGDAMAKAAPRPAPSRKEREIQAAILSYLRTVPGVVVWRNNVGAVREGARFVRFGFKGLSDIVGWRSWRTKDDRPMAVPLFIEVKKPGEYLTAEQDAFMQKARADGCLAFVARSVSDVVTHLGVS